LPLRSALPDNSVPLALLPRLMEGVSLFLEAAAQADGAADLFRRLESCGLLIRLDPGVEPTMFRCATREESRTSGLIASILRKARSLPARP
jgi:hypothetical protein